MIKPLINITNITEKVGWKSAKKKVFTAIHQQFGGSNRLFIVRGVAPDPIEAKGLKEFGFTFIQRYG